MFVVVWFQGSVLYGVLRVFNMVLFVLCRLYCAVCMVSCVVLCVFLYALHCV